MYQVTVASAGRKGIVKGVLPIRYRTLIWLGQNAYVKDEDFARGGEAMQTKAMTASGWFVNQLRIEKLSGEYCWLSTRNYGDRRFFTCQVVACGDLDERGVVR